MSPATSRSPTPNIFDFATGELSQDAIIAWLLKWGDTSFRDANTHLHAVGRRLVDYLLSMHPGAPALSDPVTVKLSMQSEKIDVVAEVNGRWVFIIEDKTDTNEHSNQLKKYLDVARQKWPSPREVVPIFLKTGDQASYKKVSEAGWHRVSRADLLREIAPDLVEASRSDILLNFRAHLQSIEDETASWESLPIGEWCPRACAGFFIAVQKELGGDEHCDWGRVENPAGGFLGLWWGPRQIRGGDLYVQLQLENGKQGKLECQYCIKLAVPKEEHRVAMRDFWIGKASVIAPDLDLARPPRVRTGASMTVARVDEVRRVAPDGRILFKETMARIVVLEAARIMSWTEWLKSELGDAADPFLVEPDFADSTKREDLKKLLQ